MLLLFYDWVWPYWQLTVVFWEAKKPYVLLDVNKLERLGKHFNWPNCSRKWGHVTGTQHIFISHCVYFYMGPVQYAPRDVFSALFSSLWAHWDGVVTIKKQILCYRISGCFNSGASWPWQYSAPDSMACLQSRLWETLPRAALRTTAFP